EGVRRGELVRVEAEHNRRAVLPSREGGWLQLKRAQIEGHRLVALGNYPRAADRRLFRFGGPPQHARYRSIDSILRALELHPLAEVIVFAAVARPLPFLGVQGDL